MLYSWADWVAATKSSRWMVQLYNLQLGGNVYTAAQAMATFYYSPLFSLFSLLSSLFSLLNPEF